MAIAIRKLSGAGAPNGVVSAPQGSIYVQTNASAGNELWDKRTGTGNTGWELRGSAGGGGGGDQWITRAITGSLVTDAVTPWGNPVPWEYEAELALPVLENASSFGNVVVQVEKLPAASTTPVVLGSMTINQGATDPGAYFPLSGTLEQASRVRLRVVQGGTDAAGLYVTIKIGTGPSAVKRFIGFYAPGAISSGGTGLSAPSGVTGTLVALVATLDTAGTTTTNYKFEKPDGSGGWTNLGSGFVPENVLTAVATGLTGPVGQVDRVRLNVTSIGSGAQGLGVTGVIQ